MKNPTTVPLLRQHTLAENQKFIWSHFTIFGKMRKERNYIETRKKVKMMICRQIFKKTAIRFLFISLFLIGLAFIQSSFPDGGSALFAEQNVVFDPDNIDMANPVPACEAGISENALYSEVLDILIPWVTNPNVKAETLSRGIELCRTSLESIDHISELDPFFEKVVEAHPDNWRVLKTVAEQYATIIPTGILRDGVFIRDNANTNISAIERDRVRSLQLYHQGLPFLEKERSEGKVSPEEAYDFYRGFAETCLNSNADSWRMQILTDLTTLPDYDQGSHYRFYGRNESYAPVDEEGNPIFYHIPENFESAKNDGERWHFLLHQAATSGASCQLDAVFQYANFLSSQFDPHTLRDSLNLFGNDTDTTSAEKANLTAVGSLASLNDNETIARLANGIKRFTLPDDQNPILIFRKILDSESPENGTPQFNTDLHYKRWAAQELGEIYKTRGQFVKAEEIFRKLADLETQSQMLEEERIGRKELECITGNFGAFEPTTTAVSGTNASFSWRFRNGKKAKFRAQEINVQRLISDAKNYLRDISQNPPEEWNTEKIRLEDIGWRLLNMPDAERKYLSHNSTNWTVDLNPAPDHNNSTVSIPFPLERPGAYLLRGMMENGNSDAILLWLSDTVIVNKHVQGKTLWYVADAKSGSPVQDAKLNFFGYQSNRMSSDEARILGFKTGDTGRWYVTIKEFEEHVDKDGCFFFNAEDSDIRNRWLVTAQTTTEDGSGRFAYYGFSKVWHDQNTAENFSMDQACFLSDRPIYRPNDTIHFRFWGGKSDYSLPDIWSWQNRQARLTVIGPDGREILKKDIKLDETGGYEDQLETDESFNLGFYSFRLDVAADSNSDNNPYQNSPKWQSAGFGQVCLEEYRKPEFEVTVNAPETPIKLGEPFKAKVQAKYYFGSPVTHAVVRWRVTRIEDEGIWYPPRPWDWLYGKGYGWLAPNADWFPGWSNWGIAPPLPMRRMYFDNPELVMSGEDEIGEDGTIEIPIETSIAAILWPNKNQNYTITAEVTDDSRRTVTGTGNVTAVKKPFNVYSWTEKGFYRPGDQVDVSVQARRVDSVPITGAATIYVSKIHYTKENDSTEGVLSETEVFSEEIRIDADGKGKSSFILNDPGKYHIVCKVTDGAGNSVEGGSLISIIDSGTPAADIPCSNPIEIVLEKPEYQPGEKAQIQISTPFPNASVLLFLRSEGGNAGEPILLRLKEGTTIYELDIRETDTPNIWLEALTVHNGHFFHTSKNVPVPPAKRILNVQVTPDKDSYLPGETAHMEVKVSDTNGNPVVGEITATVYDRSLDALARANEIDLKSLFWNWTRYCSPEEGHTLDKIFEPIQFPQKVPMPSLGIFNHLMKEFGADNMGRIQADARSASLDMPLGIMALSGSVKNNMVTDEEYEVEAAPAAAPESTMGKRKITAEADELKFDQADAGVTAQQALIRSNFADTALWTGRLQTNDNGIADLSFTMPENLTSWKTRVWSFAPGTRVGEGETETVTRKNIIVRMQKPRFLTQTDTVLLSANVHNYTDQEQKITVSLKTAPGHKNEGAASVILRDGVPASQEIQVPAGGEARVDWEVDAAGSGNSTLTMTAVAETESDGILEEIPVNLHGIMKQTAVSGTIPPSETEGERKETFSVTVPEERIPEKSALIVRYSPTLAGAMLDAIPYLTHYPYGCTEQTLNRFLPTVQIRKLLTDSGFDLEAIQENRANLNPQELGDQQRRRREWNVKRDIFGEPVSETEEKESDPVFNAGEIARRVEEGVSRLREMECSDGGWSWFGGWGAHSDPYLTALIVDGLFQAMTADVDVPEDMLTNGISWLSSYQIQECRKLQNGAEWDAETKQKTPDNWKSAVANEDVLVFFVLSNWNTFESRGNDNPDDQKYRKYAKAMNDFIWRDRTLLSPYSLALYGMALLENEDPSDADRERLEMIVRMIRQYQKTDDDNQTTWLELGGKDFYGGYWFNDEIETESAFLRLLVRMAAVDSENPIDPDIPKLIKHLINNRKNATYWKSTRDTAYVLATIWEYLSVTGELSNEGKVEIWIDGELKKTETITAENLFTIDNTLILEGNELTAGTHNIEIRFDGTGPLYYNAYLANFTLEPFIRKAGLETEITRTYWKLTDDEAAADTVSGSRGEPINQQIHKMKRERLEDGASIKSGDLVEVELNVSSRNDYESILIEDRKPAGFEPLNPVSGYNGGELGAYTEYRDSRVCFFVHRLPQGTHTLTYLLRAETPGTVSALPASIEGVYAPELRGNSDEFQTTVLE